ncbi:hypothetical protein LRP30_40705 [Bradyrhizobium sp. C-145]|jgi:hypothetical protein|uniref:hypothetical protein n=1 Tax=Bradyrhizobium sp. C-145 TaxID=574727 RepID=UPI00201B9297|nr:hypothetical protein [Bradyrhizobium sp. C-145]UQR62990.1 hypothetical protein LRP30_40705 [Bradyrhizobium sp. C-145]
MSGIDLEFEFERTGLPRTALAAFLGLDNALISRLSDGRRSWKPHEYKRARSFFDLVPQGSGPLVKRLRRRDTRQLIGPTLAEALINLGHRAAFGILFRAVSEGAAELRADQIVALCRKFNIDLAHLMTGRGIRMGAWPGDELTLINYEEACRRDEGNAFANSDVGGDRKRSRRAKVAKFADRESLADRITACEPFIVMDDELEPRYRRGETIYIDGSARECRYGDDVVMSRDGGDAVIGMLSAADSETVLIETPSRGRISVPVAEIVSMRRISFTER